MHFKKEVISAVLILLFGLTGILPVLADIYCYRDENGVMHFTNVNTESRYRLYMRTSQKDPIEYIKEYDGIIDQASRRFGIDSALIKAVIKAESDFDHQAVSRKGAQGLMQLMPDTADEMRVQDPFDPAENIFGGARYLGLMLRRFNNDHQLALAAYNAGPENVETYKGVPPFPETKAFIKRVMEYYHEYIAATQ
jgi:soluble lytic murein transglycosylase-like protein